MARICDGNWKKSKIKNVDDGTIEIKEDRLGFLGGTHNKSGKGIVGFCFPGAKPHITFARHDGTSFLIYEGDIEQITTPRPMFVIVNGTVTKMSTAKDKEAPRADDWTAEKPT